MIYSRLAIRQEDNKAGREVSSYRSETGRMAHYHNITDASELRLERLARRLGISDMLLMDGWMTVFIRSEK